MDNTIGKREGAGTHIWLRHAVQFVVGERTHTIEMEIPVPIGASTEEWEQLLLEAEARMQQLANRVEGRSGQRQVPVQNTASSSLGPVRSPGAPSVKKATTPPAAPAIPTPVPTPAAPPTREVSQAPPPERKERSASSSPTPTRTSIGASMPGMTAIPGDTGDSLKLPQFIQYIKDAMGLTPKQAMELLNVKTLSGLNYRDAIEQLQQLVSRDGETRQLASLSEEGSSNPESKRQSASNPGEESEEDEVALSPSPAPLMPSSPASYAKHTEINELHHAVVREVEPAYFDEEDDPDIDNVEEGEVPLALSVHDRAIAENVLSRLREARGSSVASDNRLKVLKNVVGDQLSNEQLLQLIQGVWGVNGLKKLKNDQLEALISWAKEDEFMNEAEIVLAVLQEDEYARSDR